MDIREGLLGGTLPYIALGTGPPLLVFSGLSMAHENPKGVALRFETQTLKPFAEHFTVHEVNRKPGLASGATMHDIASDYALAIDKEFGAPVDLIGISTGGSVAQQLAIDNGSAVNRLILASTACRLGPFGKEVQLRVADHATSGRVRAAYREVGGSVFASSFGQRLGGWVASLVGPMMMGRTATADMIVTILAEDAFDAEPDLPRVTTPTLIIAGDRDRLYSPELFRLTAERIPNAQLMLYEGKGHVGALTGKRFPQDALRFLKGS